jgi:hypothetical protein
MSVLGIDSGEITGYPEVMPRSKLSATRARSRLLGSRTSGLWACHGQLWFESGPKWLTSTV